MYTVYGMPRARSRRAKATAAQTVRGVGGARKFDHNEYAVVNGTASTMALMPRRLPKARQAAAPASCLSRNGFGELRRLGLLCGDARFALAWGSLSGRYASQGP